MSAALPAGYRRIAYESVGSTNDEAKRLAAAGAAEGLVVTAAAQQAGRGRLGRQWASPPGNLYASFVLRPAVPMRRAPEVAFVAAVAVHETATALAPGRTVRCKWPNDVLVEGRKIAGILAEATARPDGGVDHIVLGIGLNLAHFPAESRWPAASFAALGLSIGPEEALAVLAGAVARWRADWEAQGFAPVRAAWTARSFPAGTPLALDAGQRRLRGGFAGIDADGALLLDVAGGARETVAYGEVTNLDIG